MFDTRELVNGWLDSHPTPALFLFFHNYDIHSASSEITDLPYFPVSEEHFHFAKALDPPPSFERKGEQEHVATQFLLALNRGELALPMEEERDYIIALYDDTIRVVDLALHEFFERLKKLGLYDRALIIVTSDHGESFGEHGLYLHREVYESCCRVPLIIKFPHGKFAGRRVTDLVQLVDLFPTVLDVLGLLSASEVDGRSLVGLLNGRAEPRPYAYIRRSEDRAVRTLEWKLVRNNLEGDYELYRLVDDPEEQHNLYADAPPALAVLSEELDRFHQLEMEGWHLAFENPDTSRGIVEMQFVCRTGDEFEACAIVFGETVGESGETYSRSADGHSVVGAVRLRPPDRDELIVKTSSPEGKILLTVAGKQPFIVRMGGETLRPGTQWETILDTSAARSYPKPDTVEGEPTGEPALTVWYEVPAIKGPRARELTKEELEHLRAIGYVR